MNQHKYLYKQAKRLQTEEAWSNYRKLKNEITNSIRSAHCRYQNGLFADGERVNRKSFWKYIKTIRKDQFGVAPLNIDGVCVNNSKHKAESLNNLQRTYYICLIAMVLLILLCLISPFLWMVSRTYLNH